MDDEGQGSCLVLMKMMYYSMFVVIDRRVYTYLNFIFSKKIVLNNFFKKDNPIYVQSNAGSMGLNPK